MTVRASNPVEMGWEVSSFLTFIAFFHGVIVVIFFRVEKRMYVEGLGQPWLNSICVVTVVMRKHSCLARIM